MAITRMNQQIGKKWFIFFTKVRPWISVAAFITPLIDFIQYPEVYFDYWWAMLSFAVSIAQVVLSIMVFVKSRTDYVDFVTFIKGELIFEIIGIPYQAAVKQYIQKFEAGSSIIVFLVMLIVGYFLWYRLNVKYFERRILTEAESIPSHTAADSEQFQPGTSDQALDYYTANITPPAGENTKANNQNIAASDIHFCGKCGCPLTAGDNFCQKCGNKISFDNRK